MLDFMTEINLNEIQWETIKEYLKQEL